MVCATNRYYRGRRFFFRYPILEPVAHATLVFGLLVYAVMLPLMVYRLIFSHEVPDAAKPTIAIMAAPASLSLAGYLTVTANPSPSDSLDYSLALQC